MYDEANKAPKWKSNALREGIAQNAMKLAFRGK
jgi:hypothetical protein